MARVGGSMLVAGGVLSLVLTFATPNYANGRPAMVYGSSTVAIALGAVCIGWAERMPRWLLYLLPTLGTAMICVTMLVTETPSDGSELLLIWPVLFAGYFLPGVVAWANLVAVVGAYTPVALLVMGRAGLTPSANLAGTSLITLLIVTSLRSRITELLAASQAEARTDGLTGLLNRRACDEALVREVARCSRQQVPLSLVMVDLDHFKRLNDRAGHPAGDAALRRVAMLLQTQVRQSDVLGRIGGEEFLLLLPDCSAADAAERAEEVRALVDRRSRDWPYPVTVSVGVAAIPTHADSGNELLAAADNALYAAKTAGRNTVRLAAGTDRPGAAGGPAEPAAADRRRAG